MSSVSACLMTCGAVRGPFCNRLKASVFFVGKKAGMDMGCMTEQLVVARVAPCSFF